VIQHPRYPRIFPAALAALAALAAVTLAAGTAAADAKREAKQLAAQAAALAKQGKHAEACAALEASIERRPQLAVRAKLAACYERVNRLTDALALHREVAEAARKDRDRKRERAARARIAELEVLVPRFVIRVAPEAALDGLAITHNGAPVTAAELGQRVPIEFGTHVVTASAPGRVAWTREVQVPPGTGITFVAVDIPVLEPPAPPPPPPPVAAVEPEEPDTGAVKPGSKRAKELAQGLVTEGVALVEKREFQLGLDRFVAAYELYPTPKLLLNMASALREMNRPADAADMYQAFIEAPDTNAEFVGEAKAILNQLDQQLYVLMVRVNPRGADVQLDGGPWIAVGEKRMMVRLRPGLHMVRARRPGYAIEELTVNAFEGEKNDLELVLDAEPVPAGAPATTIVMQPASEPESRAIRAGGASKDGRTIIPMLATGARAERGGALYRSTAVIRDDDDAIVAVVSPGGDGPGNELGVTAQLRIDGGGGGAAVAAGFSFAPGSLPSLELDLTGMVSKPVPPSGIEMEAERIYGVFLGARYRLFTGTFRPTLGVGVPTFYSDGELRIGARGSAGLEIVINGHLAIGGELGYEHFFNTQPGYDADVFVPLVQLTARL
jgi:tetratricopeptide (TPR) repeat protein